MMDAAHPNRDVEMVRVTAPRTLIVCQDLFAAIEIVQKIWALVIVQIAVSHYLMCLSHVCIHLIHLEKLFECIHIKLHLPFFCLVACTIVSCSLRMEKDFTQALQTIPLWSFSQY